MYGTDRKSGLIRLDFYFGVEYNLFAVHIETALKSCIWKESGASPERCRHRNLGAHAGPLGFIPGKAHGSDEEEPGYLHIQRMCLCGPRRDICMKTMKQGSSLLLFDLLFVNGPSDLRWF